MTSRSDIIQGCLTKLLMPSRIPPEAELSTIIVPTTMDLDIIPKEVDQDAELQKIIEELTLDPLMHPKYTIDHDRLLYKNMVVLSNKSALIPTILHMS